MPGASTPHESSPLLQHDEADDDDDDREVRSNLIQL
jgi:hypothetical protein